ncbi:MAG: hypothetical protein E5X56_27225, partial [Mesorhizobium sp.]
MLPTGVDAVGPDRGCARISSKARQGAGLMPLSRTLKLAFRFSLREMRGGLSGFLIFLACIALG